MISLDMFYGILTSKEIIIKVTDLTYFMNSVANSLNIKPSDFMVRFLKAIDLKMYKNIHSVCDKISSLGFEKFCEVFEKELILLKLSDD